MSTLVKDKRPVLWSPTEKQSEFLSCPAREVLFAGSVGSGKTDAILMAGLSQVNNRAHRALLLRRTFPMLRDLIGRSHELFLPLGATFQKQESVWTFPSGARVEFGFLDADEDKYRYMGRQFSMIGWDELTSWPGDSTDNQGQPCSGAYLYMMSRLRAVEGSDLRLEVRATCTPGGIGHSWVKNRWNIPNDGSSSEVVDPATGFRRVFIRATIKDNPYLAGTSYEKSLEALPAATRKALLQGRWDVFEGAVFSEWDYNKHTCAEFRIPDSWEMWRGLDDGMASPCCCLWATHDPVRDIIFICDEIYQRGLLADQLARAIRAIDEDYGGDLDGVADSSMWADLGMGIEGGKGSRGHVLNGFELSFKPCVKDRASRIQRVSQIHQRLAINPVTGLPGLVIFRRCRNLIRELPALVYSKTNPEDVDTDCSDHGYDALRYLLGRKKATWHRMTVRGL